MRFAVFTHVQHAQRENLYYAYSPYVREMNLWFRHVKEVEVVAPLSRAKGSTYVPYAHDQIIFTQTTSINFLSGKNVLQSLIKIPNICHKIWTTMRRADHLHLRCPGNIGLIACLVQIFFPSKPKTAKYAGNWDPEAKQPWSYNLQKWILSNTFLTRNMQVLVYGEWPGQSKNVKSFFTASFSEKETSQVPEKNFEEPFTFLFVGNLVPGKHPMKAIQLVQEISRLMYSNSSSETPGISLKVYGDGPERRMLETFCKNEKLEELVKFKGNRPLEELKEAYQKAHFIILPSQSEGWPKAIAEGMFFGCIPIATPVSCVPWILGDGKRGVLLEETVHRPAAKGQQPERSGQRSEVQQQEILSISTLLSDANKILSLLKDPEEMPRKSKAAKAWSQQYTLEKFEVAMCEILNYKL